MKTTAKAPAFTLVEMLVVIGIFALVAGVLGFGLRGGNSATALRAGQEIVAHLLADVRGTAKLTGARATLIVAADNQSQDFLRRIYLATESAPGADRWLIAADGVMLPAGVFMVPGPTEIEGAAFAATWPGSRRSSLERAVDGSVIGTGRSAAGTCLWMSTPFGNGADPGGLDGGHYFVALGRRTETGVIFERPESVRGIALSAYGMGMHIDDDADLDL